MNVIAHSMGGLDSRYLIAHGGGRNIIETLITLGTPFRGTLAADIAADPRQLARVSPASLLKSIAEFVAATTLGWPFDGWEERLCWRLVVGAARSLILL